VRPPSPTLRAALSAVVVLAPLVGCGARERRIGGRVTEFGTGRPVPGAAVTVAWRGWGRAPDGQLVWDKDYTIDARAGADGRFSVAYRGPGSAKVTVVAAGFQPLSRWLAAGDDAVTARLKRRDPGYRPLPGGTLALGEAPDGRAPGGAAAALGGWDFATATETGDPARADLLVAAVVFAPSPRVTARATGAGGVRFVSAAEVGAEGDLLAYADTAPAAGYAAEATLAPGVRPGVLFVRTRDGAHYAKVEVGEHAATEQAPSGGRRAAVFRYVYNPAGGRDLRFEAP
jgi:hypothetical protein